MLYAILLVLLHVPAVQRVLGESVALALADKLGTKVEVGNVNLGFFNRLIADDVNIYDQQGDSMLYAARVSVKLDYLPLVQGRVEISSAQLFGLKANLYKNTALSKPNYQFALDSLASKDTTRHTPLDLHIGSLIIRRGAVKYIQRDAEWKKGVLSPKHLIVSGLSAHVIVNHVTDTTANIQLKNLAFHEGAGLQVESLRFTLKGDKEKATLSNFCLKMPATSVELDNVSAQYRWTDGKPDLNTLYYNGNVSQSKITISDIACLVPVLKPFDETAYLSGHFSGTTSTLTCSSINFRTGSGSINLQAGGSADFKRKTWSVDLANLNVTQQGIDFVASIVGKRTAVPTQMKRLGTIHLSGKAQGYANGLSAKGKVETDAGNVRLKVKKNGELMEAHAATDGVDLGRILDSKKWGNVVADITLKGMRDNLTVKGSVAQIEYGGNTLKNIKADGAYHDGTISGNASIADRKATLNVIGDYSTHSRLYNVKAHIAHLQPDIFGLKTADHSYVLRDISISANNKSKDGYLDVEAPFMSLFVRGQYNPATVYASVANLVADKISTQPLFKKQQSGKDNDFTLQANITSTEILRRMFGVDLVAESPIHISGNISSARKDLNLYVSAPEVRYGDKSFSGITLDVNTVGDSLITNARFRQGPHDANGPSCQLWATAADNMLSTQLDYDNHSAKLPLSGKLKTLTQFLRTEQNTPAAHITICPSEIMLGETKWDVLPAHITYRKNELTMDMLTLSHDDQHIIVNGRAAKGDQDSIVADLKGVDVAYVLDLVNFHSVDFAGKATGKAVVKSIFGKPDVYADLNVDQFSFEQGPMGVLHAHVAYDNKEERIKIKAEADDGPQHMTYIDGYVSPKENFIDLGINAEGTSLKFMESFCGSFMDQVEAWCDGKMNVVGDLSSINLVGDVTAHGSLHMKQLGTTYTFNNVKAHAVPDEIQLLGDSICDREFVPSRKGRTIMGHYATVEGAIHHKHLTKLSYDLDIDAHNFLGFDTHSFGENTFYGTVFATGKVDIHGKSGQTVINIDAQPEQGSIFVYNVASPDAISDKNFIHWHDVTQNGYVSSLNGNGTAREEEKDGNLSSDIRINFMINTSPLLTLKLVMDEQTGDYITLNGSGVIRANYFNKGAFDMFGNYVVEHGVYKLTIQNIIKKDFEFMPGGTISFGGDPYNAPLALQAKYTVTGVPLSDLNIGRSFSSNNIRVDCLMDITGTPGAPKVAFSMDLPTVNSDAKQMVYSLINSQEEMNQQVLYLLSIGRFYAQRNNNQNSQEGTQQSQTSLAMQSILSGTISQQINNVLSSVVNSNKWSFGANISTGDEGFYNAEYEGLLSGRLLNNRLLFNGQFGYRDNANTTQSFIGDFDLRYLIFPNGNLSVHVYNQANDRYFTRNSLNTQGLGIIMKKDFNNFWDLFGIKRKEKKVKNEKK